jgi:hypothetical protein
MILTILKIVCILTIAIVFCIWIVYWIVKLVKPTAINLNNDGWILIHPNKNPVAFNNAPDANIYAEHTRRAGIFWDVYAIHRGKIIFCGNTENSIIA